MRAPVIAAAGSGRADRRVRATAAPEPDAAGSPRGTDVRLGPLQDYIGFHLRRAQDVAFQAFRRRVGDPGLSPGKFAFLALIGANPGINQTTLSRVTGRDKSTLTPALRDLVDRGWVQRERACGDRRAYALRLSASGREHLRRLNAHAEQHDRELDSLVSARYKPIFIDLLERIVRGFDQRAPAGQRRRDDSREPIR